MTDRIRALVQKTVAGELLPPFTPVEYDRTDLFLPPVQMSAKRVSEYILAQEPVILPESCFTGLLRFDGSVEGDLFHRSGHRNFRDAYENFYNKPVENLLTFEWQHAVGNYGKVIRRGFTGLFADIAASEEAHAGDDAALEFLRTQRDILQAILKRAHRVSAKVSAFAETVSEPACRENLLQLSKALTKVPEFPAESFYEAVLCLVFCYSYLPDSIGLIDRYLYPYYRKDIDSGKLTEDRAAEYLQELFLLLQGRISIASDRFYRGGESHFCIGGYLEDHTDGFNDLSRLIVESLLELPTWIPQISLRWTEETPREVLRYMLDKERNDPNKRIAFVNDEPRLRGLMNYGGHSWEEAVSYTMMGCNELALPGGMVFGFDPFNIVRSVETLFHKRREELLHCPDFEAFYAMFEEELFRDLWRAEEISKGLQTIRSRDCNLVSNFLLEGCIRNAKSCTQGGLDRFVAVGLPIGLSTVIDSLAVTRQLVFEEKSVSMETLTDALAANWEGHEELLTRIRKTGCFFGNDDDISNDAARRLMHSLGKWNNTENYLGKKWLFGNLVGYNEHHKWFGEKLAATPDGRFAGEAINFGIGQTGGRDRSGLTALLHSVAKCDPEAVLTGPSVTNILLEAGLMRNEASFEKLVDLFEAYFRAGGTHFQLTYVSPEEMRAAKQDPETHRSLRVRVSGFSDYFRNLNDALQDEMIRRTEHT